jgi:hypothetical protein
MLKMTPNKIYITLIGLLFWKTSFSQTEELRKIDNSLSSTFQKMVTADPQLRYDSLAPAFKKQLTGQLENPITFKNSLDSLSKYLTIKTSTDGKIKFYSWDELGGGTWHNINCLAQFKSDNGKIIVQQLNSENEGETGEFTDSKIYEVNVIKIGKTTYYMTFGWGTHGSGNQHNIIQVFKITGDTLTKFKSFFSDNKDFVVEYPRGSKLNLIFNPETNEISYNEFKQGNDSGFYKSTGQIITLRLTDGVFKTK